MKTYLSLLLSLFALCLTALAGTTADKAAAPVQVSYTDADKYTDFKSDRFDSESGRADLEEQFTAHLNKLGAELLAPGQRLEVKFTNIDLAGAYEPWRGPQFDDVRIMKDIYPPRMSLEFRLLDAGGKLISEGKRELSDLSYLMQTLLPTSDGLRFDKKLLTDWMRNEFHKK